MAVAVALALSRDPIWELLQPVSIVFLRESRIDWWDGGMEGWWKREGCVVGC